MNSLRDIIKEWNNWAADAEKSEESWQSDYPSWDKLIQVAILSMLNFTGNTDDLKSIEFCWKISEETEDMADFAKHHITECWMVLESLAVSPYSEVRWQVYDVLGFNGDEAQNLLRVGLTDEDSYCRRRAVLSLSRFHLDDAQDIAEKLIQDKDPYIRQSAVEVVRNSKDKELIHKVKTKLQNDSDNHVREAAQKLED